VSGFTAVVTHSSLALSRSLSSTTYHNK